MTTATMRFDDDIYSQIKELAEFHGANTNDIYEKCYS